MICLAYISWKFKSKFAPEIFPNPKRNCLASNHPFFRGELLNFSGVFGDFTTHLYTHYSKPLSMTASETSQDSMPETRLPPFFPIVAEAVKLFGL